MVRCAKPSCTGTKHMASERKKSSSSGQSASGNRVAVSRSAEKKRGKTATARSATPQHFVVCVRNDDYPASLELRKLYAVLDDTFADEHDLIRVIDESGEDYLYPAEYFVRIELPKALEQAFSKIA